jgi:hypothetical protein
MTHTPNNAAIDLARLEQLLDTYGPDPMRFPEAEREAARALIARDRAARALLAEAEALARTLDALPAPQPSAALQRAVAEIPLRHAQTSGALELFALSPFRSMTRAMMSAVVIVVLGVLSGVWSADSDSSPDVALSAAEADEWHDVSALAFATDLDKELAP